VAEGSGAGGQEQSGNGLGKEDGGSEPTPRDVSDEERSAA
jgi:hypothetical protein